MLKPKECGHVHVSSIYLLTHSHTHIHTHTHTHTYTHTHTHHTRTVTGNQQGSGENLPSEEAVEDEVSEGEPGSDIESERPQHVT